MEASASAHNAHNAGRGRRYLLKGVLLQDDVITCTERGEGLGGCLAPRRCDTVVGNRLLLGYCEVSAERVLLDVQAGSGGRTCEGNGDRVQWGKVLEESLAARTDCGEHVGCMINEFLHRSDECTPASERDEAHPCGNASRNEAGVDEGNAVLSAANHQS